MAYIDNVNKVLNIQPEAAPTRVRLSQNENGRNLYFTLAGNENPIPSGVTVTMIGTKPDGTVYSGTGSISNDVVLIPETVQLTAVAGVWDAKVKITSGGNTVATGRIRFLIDADTVAPGSVPSSSVLEGLVEQAQQYAETARQEAYGSPLTAALASDMTDKTRVYVYTGSEVSYTAGHWYYWNGSAWTDGGVYNSTAVQTDKTLSLMDVPADGKAVGDAIATDKTLSIADAPADAQTVGLKFSYIRDMIAGVETTTIATKEYSIGDLIVVRENDTLYEAIKAITTGTEIKSVNAKVTTIDEAISSRIMSSIDSSLTQTGKAADAKVVGDELDSLKGDLKFEQTGVIELESGTYVDANGTQKYATLTRIRNSKPIPIKDIESITVPTGYSAWIFRLDITGTLISAFGSWVGGQINIETIATSATKYINFAIRNDSTPSGDISGQVSTVQNSLICKYIIDTLSADMNELLKAADETDFVSNGSIYVKFDTGENMSSSSWTACKIINKGFGKIKAKLVSANNANAAIIAFYNDETILNSTTYMGAAYAVKAINGTCEYFAIVPEGCKTIMVCTRETTFDNAEVVIYTNKTIDVLSRNIDSVTEDITNIETDIDNIEENLISIDATLTQANKAGDAKAIGDALTNLRNELSGLNSDLIPFPVQPNSKYGTLGKILSTEGNGKTKWIDQITPTDEQVNEAISSWLTSHPEATTTVQDGSITENKLNSVFKPYVLNCYTTPEMFGAVGDGLTDDSVSIQTAIDYVNNQGGGIVQFGNKTYICQNILPKNNVTLRGTGSSVLKLPTTPSSHLIYYYGDTVINNFNLDNLQFDGGSQTTYDLLHIEKQSSAISYIWDKSVVNQCWFSNARVGISCSIPGNVKIVNTVCQYNDIGIQQRNEHFHFINSMLWGNRIGADLYRANHFTWVNVTFAHNTEYGIYADASFESCLCACSFIDTGICVYGPIYSYRFIGCRMIESTRGIYGAYHKNIIDGCYFSSMTDVAIEFNITGCFANVVANCEFTGNSKGVVVIADDHLIHANVFRQTKQSAIEISGSASLGVQISNNIIIDASTNGEGLFPGIKITAPYFVSCLISNNSIRNTGSGKASYAIDMDATFTNLTDTMVMGNIARNMKTSGYRIPARVTKANNIGTVVTA